MGKKEDDKKVQYADVSVFCRYNELVPIEKMVPHPRNTNEHPESQIQLLAKIIKAQGWRRPITVSKRSGFITRGHGALLAAKAAEFECVPVEYQEYENEAAEVADMNADNRLATKSTIDRGKEKDLINEFDDGAFDLELFGYNMNELENLMTEFHVEPEPQDDPSEDKATKEKSFVIQYNIIFNDESEQAMWHGYLRYLKGKYPDKETISEMLVADIKGRSIPIE